MKRLLDILFASLALLVLGPLLLVIWAAIVLTSGFPGIFRQQRVGRNGVPFALFKFRTMTVNKSAEKGTFEAGSVARITRIGKLLRNTKLDEIPQLWNVLRGDMSIVGPRPEVQKWVQVYPQRWSRILAIRPGITDEASIRFRNEEDILSAADDPETAYRKDILPRKLELYEAYVQSHSVWGDLVLILRTLWTVIRH